MRTLEQLAGWILFSLSILMIYGFLSLFLIGPVHAQQGEDDRFSFFSKKEVWDRMLAPQGVDVAETTDDSQYYYQLTCGPTKEHHPHGCGGFPTLTKCQEAGRKGKGLGYWECVRVETPEHN